MDRYIDMERTYMIKYVFVYASFYMDMYEIGPRVSRVLLKVSSC